MYEIVLRQHKCDMHALLLFSQASCNPVAYSFLADFFPPQHRALALSVYHYGVYLGELGGGGGGGEGEGEEGREWGRERWIMDEDGWERRKCEELVEVGWIDFGEHTLGSLTAQRVGLMED